jgi:predicted unusual protein kinase regulating ubiquinone biosynthesis (AarF/ABC1/UbiB family)
MVSFLGFLYLIYQLYIVKNGYYINEEKTSEKLINYLQNLGPFFVKLAQTIAIKCGGTFPDNIIIKMRSLQDNVKHSFTPEIIKNMISPNVTVSEYIPVASGSFAAVFKGEYKGQTVAIKIKHPGLDVQIEKTEKLIKTLKWLLKKIRPFVKPFTVMDISNLLSQMLESLKYQFNFSIEANNANIVKSSIGDICVIPTIFHEVSDENVIVMEWIDIIKFRDIKDVISKEECYKLAEEFSYIAFRCILVHKFIHGDVHEGNIFWTKQENGNYKLGMCDFGCCAYIDDKTAKHLFEIFSELIANNVEKAANLMLRHFIIGIPTDKLRRELEETFDTLINKDTSVGNYTIKKLYKPLLKSKCVLNTDYAHVEVYILMCESMCSLIDPTFHLSQQVKKSMKRMLMEGILTEY